MVVTWGAPRIGASRTAARALPGGGDGPALPVFQPADEEVRAGVPAVTAALQAGLPFLRLWLRPWVYGPHGRKSAIAVLSEARKEALFQRHGLDRPGKRLGEGRLWTMAMGTRGPCSMKTLYVINSKNSSTEKGYRNHASFYCEEENEATFPE